MARALTEPFDGGLGRLDHAWGHVDTSVRGQVTLTSYASENWQTDSGIMQFPGGLSAGEGYGTYRFVLNTHGGAVGDYALIWPADDGRAGIGAEVDMVELDFNGDPYSTYHRPSGDQSFRLPVDADMNATHEYALRWEPGRLTGYMDGVQQWTTTNDILVDYAHGGGNEVMGVGMQASWAASHQSGDNTLTVYEVSYSPLG